MSSAEYSKATCCGGITRTASPMTGSGTTSKDGGVARSSKASRATGNFHEARVDHVDIRVGRVSFIEAERGLDVHRDGRRDTGR